MKKFVRKLPWVAIPVVVVLLLVWAFLPKPASVDVTRAGRGPMEVTVSEDGQTRIKERYVISAPLGGRTERQPLKAGDPIRKDRTVLAVLEPTDPALLDPRALAQAEAQVKASNSMLNKAQVEVQRARKASEFAEGEYRREVDLNKIQPGAATAKDLADLETKAELARQDLRVAQSAAVRAEFELKLSEAALLRTRPASPGDNVNTRLEIRAPVNGVVLKVHQESATVVLPGRELIDVGDLEDLEVKVDVLSSDAVKVAPRARVRFEHWGGEYPLEGRVRVVEPGGFLKQSALGVDEQRVWVVIDLTESLDRRKTLGDGYRVVARIVVWESPDVLKVPTGCLFRKDGVYHVYAVEGDQAVLRKVDVGHNNGIEAEVLGGLKEGEEVILHPSDQVTDGKAIKRR